MQHSRRLHKLLSVALISEATIDGEIKGEIGFINPSTLITIFRCLLFAYKFWLPEAIKLIFLRTTIDKIRTTISIRQYK